MALAIRRHFPAAYEDYMAVYRQRGLELGAIYPVKVGEKIVINAIGQENYGYDGKQYVSYDAIASIMRAVNELVEEDGVRVAMPLIGTDRGGGDWKIIAEIIEREATRFQPVVLRLLGMPLPPTVAEFFAEHGW